MSHEPGAVPSGEARDMEEAVRLLLISDHEHLEWSFQAIGLDRIVYEVTGQLDRRAFGLRWNQDLELGELLAGDEIRIVAHLESVRITH
jgi:hypothetical protein